MGTLILISACICSASLAAIATFIMWLVCKMRKTIAKPNYARVFLGWQFVIFVTFLALVLLTDGGHPSL
jgi:hypothetical protein